MKAGKRAERAKEGPDHVVDEVVGERDALFPLIDSIRSAHGTLVSLPAGIWHFDELTSRGKNVRLPSSSSASSTPPIFLPVHIHARLFAFSDNVCSLFRSRPSN